MPDVRGIERRNLAGEVGDGMSKPCQHAASGCDYPAGECAGHCASNQAEILHLADLLEQGRHLFHAERKEVGAALKSLHAKNVELSTALGHATERALVHKQRADQLQARFDATTKACNELAIELENVRRERDHWHARLLAEVGKRNKMGGSA